MNKNEAIGLARHMMSVGMTLDDAARNSAIPQELQELVRAELEMERNITLEPARFIVAEEESDWLQGLDRATWYYWPTLRGLLTRTLSMPALQSLDDTTDRILMYLANPNTTQFDIRGLVLGYVQSGKTTNFTATIAKATDCGYRLIIVLSGIDKGLRRQTQIRLQNQLVGVPGTNSNAIPVPPQGKQWFCVTTTDVDGDFNPGTANQAPLQGPTPVLMVVKKNGSVLRKLLAWLDGASDEVKRTIPVLVIDDEADLASIDTRGTRQAEDEPVPTDYEAPSVINGLIRGLLNSFDKKAYIAYTATPFANILIPHDAYDPKVENDLYPKDFIVDLPRPDGYFGAEALFGRMDSVSDEQTDGIDVIRTVPDSDVSMLEDKKAPVSLENAILCFVLSGAARAYRGEEKEPATMLIHISHKIESHAQIEGIIKKKFSEFKDGWRYQRKLGIQDRLAELWKSDFQPIIQATHPKEENIEFAKIEPFINKFFELVQIRTINSFTGDILNYQEEPDLKVIAIGGNRLSRGLTLEGLLSSYFVRHTATYDTLMQMGRWFGFRGGYDDLTRIWTTEELAGWFSDLAFVEHRLREDIRMYEDMDIKPLEVGARIWQHPSMQVTSQLKRRFASETTISQTYSGSLEQTFKFPFANPDALAAQEDANLVTTKDFLKALGTPVEWDASGPIWSNVSGKQVAEFLVKIRQDASASGCSLPLIASYIEHQLGVNELRRWTVAVRGLKSKDSKLGEVDWGIAGGHINQISRTRRKISPSSLGVITSPGDEKLGLENEKNKKQQEEDENNPKSGQALRNLRSPDKGLLLIYPISKYSTPGEKAKARQNLFENPDDAKARNLIGFAISLPRSEQPQEVEAYLEGTVGWRPVP